MPVFTSSKSLIAGGNKNNYKYCVFSLVDLLETCCFNFMCVCVCVCVWPVLFMRTKLSAGISFNYIQYNHLVKELWPTDILRHKCKWHFIPLYKFQTSCLLHKISFTLINFNLLSPLWNRVHKIYFCFEYEWLKQVYSMVMYYNC